MITLPVRGERQASARPTVLSCRHRREVTRRDSSWLTGIKVIGQIINFLLLYQPISVTLPTRPQPFHSQKQGLWKFWTAVFFSFFFLHGPLTASGPRCSCTGCTADTYTTGVSFWRVKNETPIYCRNMQRRKINGLCSHFGELLEIGGHPCGVSGFNYSVSR